MDVFMKKIISAFLMILLLCSALSVSFTSLAAGTPTLEIGTAQATAGGNVNVPIYLRNNPGVWSVKISVAYDNENLQLTDALIGEVFTGGELTLSPLTNETFVLYSEAASFTNNTNSGLLITLCFHVSEDAKSGDYDLTFINKDSSDIIKYNAEAANYQDMAVEVAFSYTDGKIEIPQASNPGTQQSSKTTAPNAGPSSASQSQQTIIVTDDSGNPQTDSDGQTLTQISQADSWYQNHGDSASGEIQETDIQENSPDAAAPNDSDTQAESPDGITTSNNKSDGLSTGTIVLIVVIILILAVGGYIIYATMRKKSARQTAQQNEKYESILQESKPEEKKDDSNHQENDKH